MLKDVSQFFLMSYSFRINIWLQHILCLRFWAVVTVYSPKEGFQTPLILISKGPCAAERGETIELSCSTNCVFSQTKFSCLLPVLATNSVAILDLCFQGPSGCREPSTTLASIQNLGGDVWRTSFLFSFPTYLGCSYPSLSPPAWKHGTGGNVHLKEVSEITSETFLQTCIKWERGHLSMFNSKKTWFMFVNLNYPCHYFSFNQSEEGQTYVPQIQSELWALTKERKHGMPLDIHGSSFL